MENNRRSFFKGLAAFASGVVAAKVSAYVPKKEEPKEELMVSSAIIIKDGGEEYHPLVVKKTDVDTIISNVSSSSYARRESPKIRKANV
jgi:hypothetical protein